MDDSGSESPLTDAPSTPSSPVLESKDDTPSPPPETRAKTKAESRVETAVPSPSFASTSVSRRSSRLESRSSSPDKLASPAIPSAPLSTARGEGQPKPKPIKIKLRLHSPTKDQAASPAPLVHDPIPITKHDGVTEKVGGRDRGKKRKSETGREGEVRREMGKKKSKISHSHSTQEPEPTQGPTLSSRNGVASKRFGAEASASASLLTDLFDDDEDEEGKEIVVEQKEVEVERKANKKAKKNPRRAVDSVKGDEVMPLADASTSPAPATERNDRPIDNDQDLEPAPPAVNPGSKTKSNSKVKLKVKQAASATGPKIREDADGTETKTKSKVGSSTPPSEAVVPVTKENAKDSGVASSDTKPKAKEVDTSKPKKSFAQAVTGTASPHPAPSTEPKKEKRPLPSVPKFAKQPGTGSTSTPQKPSGTGTNTPSGSSIKKTPAPSGSVQKKVAPAPSLLEQTMANLLGSGAAAAAAKGTPKAKKEDAQTPKSTPVAKSRLKGSWTNEWVLTPTEQREMLESRSEREAARAQRLDYRKNPVNLQEAKDAYKLDSTQIRILPRIDTPYGGLGVRTEGAPSKMVQALLDRQRSRAPAHLAT